MSDSITEWEFTADVASWINEILAQSPRLPFSRAKCEQRGSGSAKRRDLTLLDKNQVIILTGEVKLPFQKDGGSPYIEAVVQDARQKAQRAGVKFFFTWNVNEFVLWETFPAKTVPKDRQYKSWPVTQVHKPEHLEVPGVIHALKAWLEAFLTDFTNIYLGVAPLGTQLPDEKFLRMLESSLHLPIRLTQEELADGWLGFLTSSQWLDVEYGFRLQDWILRNFEIVAVFESLDEPWFVGARVATAVTILRRQEDAARRMQNTVRFVQLRRPIREILAHDGTTGGALQAADTFREEVLGLKNNTINERYRARLVAQGYLWQEGVRLGVMMGRSAHPGSSDPAIQDGDYYGGKWGIYLRAPDLWFELLDRLGSRFTPLGDIAEVRFGVKTGNDSFFFPIDASGQCLTAHPDADEFKVTFGVPRQAVASGQVKLVRCGAGRGEIRPIEAKYLEPELHNLMEIDGFTVGPEDCTRQILLVGEKPEEIKDRYVRSYIKWGEKSNVHQGSTCASRATADRGWYDLTGHKRGDFFWSMSQQYKHAIPANEHNLICNHNLFDISPKDGDSGILGGVLNSTWVVLSKFQYGRPVGVEGNLKTEVVDVKMMLVPDPTQATEAARERVARSFDEMKKRPALYFLSERRLRHMAYTQAGKVAELEKLSSLCELDMADRRELDDAVLEMLGVESAAHRQELLDELYGYLREFFEFTRQKEEKAIVNKNQARRRGQASPPEMAAQILAEIQTDHADLLRRYDPDFLDLSRPFDTFDLPAEGIPLLQREVNPLLYDFGVVFVKGKKPVSSIETKIPEQDALIALLARSGMRGLVRVPHEGKECERLFQEYAAFIRRREETVRELIANRTLDEDMQEKIFAALLPLIMRSE